MYYTINQMKEQAAKRYYCFVGQNATTGKPHPATGNMSYYGGYIGFATKKAAKEYADNYYNCNNISEFAVAGTVNTLRKYSLGRSWYNYLTMLLLSDEVL